MEVEKIPASNEKDAAPTEEPKLNNSSAAEPGEENNVEKAEPVIKPAEDKDDLISKIEEAVKDKPTLSQNSEEDISKSSADDFLKKIDEIEKDDKSNGEVVKAPEEPSHPVAPEPENNKIEEKPSNIEEISSDSVAVVDESGKEESKRTEAMSVDNSEGSSDDVMEVDGDLDNNKPSSEKMDVVEEKPIESIDVDLDESPKPQDVEIKDVQQSEINDVEIKEVSPEANDVEIKEISDDSNDVEIVENTEKELDVEQKMKELHGEEKTNLPKDVSELSVEEQVKQLESIAHPLKDEEKSSEETNQKDTDEVDTIKETTEPAPPSATEKETIVKDIPVVEETTEEPEKIEPSSEKPEEKVASEKCQEPPSEVEQLNGLPDGSNDTESNSDKVEEEKKEDVTDEPHKEEKEVVAEEQPKEEVLSTEVKEDVEESKSTEKAPEPKKTFSLEISCSDNYVNHLQFTSSIPEESIPTEKHSFPDLVDACDFMINKFSAIKKAICPEEVVANESTPKNKKGGSKASPILDTPAKSGKRGNKRSLPEDDEVVSTPKKSKKEPVIEEDHSNKQRVLAKWVDKKYYAGRVVAEKPNNTFAILFEDGALKNLPRKSIVFAENAESDVLPLKGHEIHALVTEDEYECGVVEKVETVKNETVYHVKCETQTVIVTAMQLYLQEDQAKLVNKSVDGEDNTSTPSGRGSRNKRAAEVASPSTPEAGFSGGVTGKRSNKRQKRYS